MYGDQWSLPGVIPPQAMFTLFFEARSLTGTRKSPTRPDRLARKPPKLFLPAALSPMLDYCTPAFTWVLGGGE